MSNALALMADRRNPLLLLVLSSSFAGYLLTAVVQELELDQPWPRLDQRILGTIAPVAQAATIRVRPRSIAARSGTYDMKAVDAVMAAKLPRMAETRRKRLVRLFLTLCHQYGFQPALVLGLIRVESDFQPKVESYAGAVGLMQVKPSTAKPVAAELGIKWRGKRTLMDPFANMRIGFHYLKHLRDRFGRRAHFVSAYNWGPTRIDRFLRQRRRLPLDYYRKVERFTRNYKHLDNIAQL